jgi:hypothetical protein
MTIKPTHCSAHSRNSDGDDVNIDDNDGDDDAE